jgi:hypothetical protein
MASYINQIDAAIAAVQPIAGQNLSVTPGPTGGLILALTPNIAVNGITANSTVTAAGGVILKNPNTATSPANEFAAPSLVFTGSYWKNTPPAAHPDSFSLDVTMLGDVTDLNSSAVMTLNHTGANIAYFSLGPQIFRFTSAGENVLGSVAVGSLFVETEMSNGTVFTLSAAANAVGNLTTYTGVISVVIPQAGAYITIAGFTNSANNGRFIVQSGAINSVTVYNSGGVAESHAATLTFDSQPWTAGSIASEGFGANTGFHLNGTAYAVTMGSQAEPSHTVPFVVAMAGNATDAGYMRIINDGATGNHGLEIGAVIDGTGAIPIAVQLGHFGGQSCVALGSSANTAATSSLEQPSGVLAFPGNYWTGSASAVDTWGLQNFLYLGHTYTLTSASVFGGGRTQYFVSSTTNPLPPLGSTVLVSGFTNLGNNGSFPVLDNRGTIIVTNAGGVNETHAGTALITAIPNVTSSLVLSHTGATNPQFLLPSSGTTYPQLSFIADPTCGLKYIGSSQLEIVAGGEVFGFSSQGGFFDGAGAMSFSNTSQTISGTADPAYLAALSAAANAVGPNTTYTGSFTPPFPTGSLINVSGFVNQGNNVNFASVVSCNATTLVLVNANGVAEVHVALAQAANPCVFIGGGGATPQNFTATLGLPKLAYDPPTAGVFTGTQAGRVWFNTNNSVPRYWDGTTMQTLHGHGINTVTTTYTTTTSDYTVLANSASPFTVTLTTTNITVDQIFRVKNINTGAITVQGQTGNIDGIASFSLPTQNSSAEFQWDGSNWWVF